MRTEQVGQFRLVLRLGRRGKRERVQRVQWMGWVAVAEEGPCLGYLAVLDPHKTFHSRGCALIATLRMPVTLEQLRARSAQDADLPGRPIW